MSVPSPRDPAALAPSVVWEVLAEFPRSSSEAIVLLRWPEEAARLERVRGPAAPPLLFLVAPGAPAPVMANELEDWVRLPTDATEVRTRLRVLLERFAELQAVPELDGVGRLLYRDRWIALSPLEEVACAQLLKDHPSCSEREALHAALWPDLPFRPARLEVQMVRLRARLRAVELDVRNVRNVGYAIAPVQRAEPRRRRAGSGRRNGASGPVA